MLLLFDPNTRAHLLGLGVFERLCLEGLAYCLLSERHQYIQTAWGRITFVLLIFLAMPLVPRQQMASRLHGDIFHPIEHVEGHKRAGCFKRSMTKPVSVQKLPINDAMIWGKLTSVEQHGVSWHCFNQLPTYFNAQTHKRNEPCWGSMCRMRSVQWGF